MKKWWCVIGVLLLVLSVHAQRLSMQLLSDQSGDGVPLVNVMLIKANQATVSDLEGYFNLNYSDVKDTLVVMGVGFELFKRPVSELVGKKTLTLKVESIVLDGVQIKGKKNERRNRKADPAYLLHKAMVERSKENDFRGKGNYSCEVYNRVEVDVNNVTDKTREFLVFRPIDFLFDDIDSTSLPKKYVPVLFSESASSYYKGERSDKEVIKGSKISGLNIKSIEKYTGNMYLSYNIYDDYLNLFQKSFVSPLATHSWLTYNFYLTDSLKRGDTTLYKLEFIPRRPHDLAFQGQLWTDNKSFAVREIHLQMMKTANVNFINEFEIDLKYRYQDSAWQLTKEDILMDVYLLNVTYGFYIKKHSSFLNYQHPTKYPGGFFNFSDKVSTWDSIADYGDQVIESLRPFANDSDGVAVYAKMDSVMNTRYMARAKSLVKMAYTGYFPFKYFELGPYYSLYSFNEIEGSRFRLGGATLVKLFPKTQFLGHLAYGTADKKYKGRARLTHFFNVKDWRYLRFDYYNDYTILSSSSNSFATDNIVASLARRVSPRFTHVKRYSGEWFHSWFNGVQNYVKVNWEEYRPIGSLTYRRPDLTDLSLIRMNTLEFGGRVALHEKFGHLGFRRFSFSTRKPIVDYNYTRGLVIGGEGYAFDKLELGFNDRFYFGFMGYLKLVAQAAKVWGKLPYPMLLNDAGNDSYYYDSQAFNLMNPFEFVSDEQLTVMLSHHFNGMIMNHVPLFKRLSWRSFVFGRLALGRLNEGQENVVLLPEGLSELKEPYLEAGVGMENIFKLLRVDFLWRLTNVGPDTQVFGVTFALQPRL